MGKRTSRQKGFYYERSLARKLWSKGFAVIRGPGSGGGSKDIIQPDLVAVKDGKIFVFEIKVRWKRNAIYIGKEKVERLKEFAKRAGGEPFIAVKIIDHVDWKFIPVDRLEKTGKGNYKVSMEFLGEALTLSNLLGLVDNSRKITEYVKED
ncbi:MAG: Holliday junction resolvase [Desulfurococcales archaeon]|nr:Holliday junction resolvase [Desulfurococcales archaeon]